MLQTLLNGLIQGGLFALLGLAFSLVYSTTRVLHIALGAVFVAAPYVLLAALHLGSGWLVGLLFALLVAALIGVLCEEVLHWPFMRRGAPPAVHLIGSLGMYMVLVQIVALIWGNDSHVLRQNYGAIHPLGGLTLTEGQLISGGGAIATIGIFFYWLGRTELGLQFRAMADSPVLLGLLGRDVRKLRRLVFAVSAILGALAALGAAYDTGFDPNAGFNAVLIGIVAAIIGGRGSLAGAALAGLLLGIIRSGVVWIASAQWEQAATFVILVLVLYFRPQGLFGPKLRLEESE